jgi:hypothetical protein
MASQKMRVFFAPGRRTAGRLPISRGVEQVRADRCGRKPIGQPIVRAQNE